MGDLALMSSGACFKTCEVKYKTGYVYLAETMS